MDLVENCSVSTHFLQRVIVRNTFCMTRPLLGWPPWWLLAATGSVSIVAAEHISPPPPVSPAPAPPDSLYTLQVGQCAIALSHSECAYKADQNAGQVLMTLDAALEDSRPPGCFVDVPGGSQWTYNLNLDSDVDCSFMLLCVCDDKPISPPSTPPSLGCDEVDQHGLAEKVDISWIFSQNGDNKGTNCGRHGPNAQPCKLLQCLLLTRVALSFAG